MDKMISCDWGTSSFRLRLINSSDLSILAARSSAQGIVATHALWNAQPAGGQNRLSFYQAILRDAIKSIERELGLSLGGVPLVISGMASSTLGMLELPYKELPFSTDGSDLLTETLSANDLFNHDTILISGARTADDVMRGEETQLVGCELGLGGTDSGTVGFEQPGSGGEEVFIFPGTHSKHVMVREARAVTFKTYMTGEFFELLSKKSILAGDVELEEAAGRREGSGNRTARFEEGVREGAGGNLLHGSFLVRTNRLLRSISKEENYYYLSGLVIGAELKELVGTGAPVRVVGEGALTDYYTTALGVLGVDGVRVVDAGEAVVRGQERIARIKK